MIPLEDRPDAPLAALVEEWELRAWSAVLAECMRHLTAVKGRTDQLIEGLQEEDDDRP